MISLVMMTRNKSTKNGGNRGGRSDGSTANENDAGASLTPTTRLGGHDLVLGRSSARRHALHRTVKTKWTAQLPRSRATKETARTFPEKRPEESEAVKADKRTVEGERARKRSQKGVVEGVAKVWKKARSRRKHCGGRWKVGPQLVLDVI